MTQWFGRLTLPESAGEGPPMNRGQQARTHTAGICSRHSGRWQPRLKWPLSADGYSQPSSEGRGGSDTDVVPLISGGSSPPCTPLPGGLGLRWPRAHPSTFSIIP